MTRFNTSDGAYTQRVSGGRDPKWRGSHLTIADLPTDVMDGDTANVGDLNLEMYCVYGGQWRPFGPPPVAFGIGDHVIVSPLRNEPGYVSQVGRVIENTMKSDDRIALTYTPNGGIRVSEYVEPERLTKARRVPPSDIVVGFLFGCKCGCGHSYE